MERKDLVASLRKSVAPVTPQTQLQPSVVDQSLADAEAPISPAQIEPERLTTTGKIVSQDLTIGEGVSFTGEVYVPGKALINGRFSGVMTADELVVYPSGFVSGTIKSRTIQVSGKLEDEVHCAELLKIDASGKVSGRVRYGHLEIQRGGSMLGEVGQE